MTAVQLPVQGGLSVGTLDGKNVVITGSGRGLGRAYAKAMAAEGARVVINDLHEEVVNQVVEEIRADGGTAVAGISDITVWDEAQRLIETCVSAFGAIDVLVNNAGISHMTWAWELTEETFDRVVGVDLKGTFNPTRHALTHMVPQKRGCIINVISGAQSGLMGRSVYSAAKAGVAGFTYAWALDLAQHNIRVNAISPLATTDRQRGVAASAESLVGYQTRATKGPENVAPLAVFLASDDAAYVTGQIVRLEGNDLSLFSHPKPFRHAIQPDGWTLEDLRKHFKDTLGQALVPVGLRAARYDYYDGLESGPRSGL
jgi:NAD(P)-dependent dehydrogenase (short-subunit alcohol dehydrogenase family)